MSLAGNPEEYFVFLAKMFEFQTLKWFSTGNFSKLLIIHKDEDDLRKRWISVDDWEIFN